MGTDRLMKVDLRFVLVAGLSTLLALALFSVNQYIRMFPPTRRFGSKVEAVIGWLWGIALARGAQGMKVRVVGEKPRGRRPFVIVANHTSMLDIFALFVALRGMDFRFVAAEELFRMPVFGWAMRRSNHIPFNRRDLRSMVETYKSLKERCFRHGQSVAVFPEGTRGPEIREFGDSIFTRAIRDGVDILPIRIWYSRGGSRADVLIGPVIPVKGMGRTDGARLSESVRQWIVETPKPAGISAKG